MNTDINIRQADITNRLSALTHYMGAKATEDSGAFERVATIDANDELFSLQWGQVVQSLMLIVKPFVSSVAYSQTDPDTGTVYPGIFLTLSMPSNWDSSLSVAVNQAASNNVFANLAALWFRIVDKNTVQEQMADALASANELRMLLHHKCRPELPSSYVSNS